MKPCLVRCCGHLSIADKSHPLMTQNASGSNNLPSVELRGIYSFQCYRKGRVRVKRDHRQIYANRVL